MKKLDLLKFLDSGMILEENHIPIVMRYLENKFDWGDMNVSEIARVKKILRKIRLESINHKRILGYLKKEMQLSGENEF